MNEETALRRGYDTTGHFTWDRDELKPKLAEYHKQGYKALIVSIPPNPLSRGHHGTGYGIVVESRYYVDQRVKASKATIDSFSARSQAIMDTHVANAQREIAKLAEKRDECAKWLAEHYAEHARMKEEGKI